MPLKLEPGATVSKDGVEVTKVMPPVVNVGGLEIDGGWVYVFDKPLTKKHKTSEVIRRFHRFERNVDKLAA